MYQCVHTTVPQYGKLSSPQSTFCLFLFHKQTEHLQIPYQEHEQKTLRHKVILQCWNGPLARFTKQKTLLFLLSSSWNHIFHLLNHLSPHCPSFILAVMFLFFDTSTLRETETERIQSHHTQKFTLKYKWELYSSDSPSPFKFHEEALGRRISLKLQHAYMITHVLHSKRGHSLLLLSI